MLSNDDEKERGAKYGPDVMRACRRKKAVVRERNSLMSVDEGTVVFLHESGVLLLYELGCLRNRHVEGGLKISGDGVLLYLPIYCVQVSGGMD